MKYSYLCSNDPTRDYGRRCDSIPPGDPRSTNIYDAYECEAKCLRPDEIPTSINNIIKMTFDRGIALPTPREFLESLRDDPTVSRAFALFKQYNTKDFVNAISSRSSVVAYSILYQHHPSIRVYELDMVLVGSRQYAVIQQEIVKIALNPIAFDIAEEFKNGYSFNPLQRIRMSDNAPEALTGHGIAVLAISIKSDVGHSNMIIVNHDTHEITHFEPNFGDTSNRQLWTYVQPLMDCGYSLVSSAHCPAGLQSVNGGPYCTIWSLLCTLMLLDNPTRGMREIFDYFIGVQELASIYLDIFTFYVYKNINNMRIPPAYVSDLVQSKNITIKILENAAESAVLLKQVRPKAYKLCIAIYTACIDTIKWLEKMSTLQVVKGDIQLVVASEKIEKITTTYIEKIKNREVNDDSLQEFNDEILRSAQSRVQQKLIAQHQSVCVLF